jgi:hypothetical protein
MFMKFYTVKIVYIYVFLTGFTSHYLCDTRNGSMECMYVRVCVCIYTYIYMRVFVCVCVIISLY